LVFVNARAALYIEAAGALRRGVSARAERRRPKMAKFAPLNMSPEEIIEYTPEWDGERFADGRPRVPDDLLERMVRFHPAGRRAHRTDSLHCLPASQPPEPPSHRCS